LTIEDPLPENNVSLIIDHLYMGGDSITNNLGVLMDFKIGYIVNCTKNCNNNFPDHIKYLTIDVCDSPREDITDYFELCSTFVDEAKANQVNCLIHCNAGMSRSGAFTLAYLMQSYKMDLLTALDLTRQKRSMTAPNIGFMKQLLKLEKRLFGFMSLDLEKYHKDCYASFHVLQLSDSKKDDANWELYVDQYDVTLNNDLDPFNMSNDCQFSPSVSLTAGTLTPSSEIYLFDNYSPHSPNLFHEEA